MIDLPIKEIDEKVILEYINRQVMEDKTLDYKRDLPEAKENYKEFLKDVTSFANALGGDILYGIEEAIDFEGKNTGKPQSICGISGNVDQVISRLENVIRDSIDPRLTPGARFWPIPCSNGSHVILLRIPQSWSRPHMLKTRDSRFWVRNSNGKHAMDAREIRAAFQLSGQIPERIRRFRDERLSRIFSGDTPIPLRHGVQVIMHLIPLSSVLEPVNLDMVDLMHNVGSITPFCFNGHNSRFNIDGVLNYTVGNVEACPGYIQFFRSGVIEAVDAYHFQAKELANPYYVDHNPLSHPRISVVDGHRICQEIIDALGNLLERMPIVGINPPLYLFITCRGLGGSVLIDNRRIEYEEGSQTGNYQINQDVLLLPDVQIDDFSVPADVVARPALDALWQAAGRAFCPNYDENGRWKN